MSVTFDRKVNCESSRTQAKPCHLLFLPRALAMKRPAKAAPAPAAKGPRSRLVRADPPPAKSQPKTAKAQAKAAPRSLDPINLALELVGDAWSLLIVRDLMLRGHTGYQAFLRSGEGIATNILADRLARLEANGLITKAPDPTDARKFIYALSSKGADLAPVLVELILFSQRHEPRIDMARDLLQEIQRNKVAYTQRLVRTNAPKVKRNPKIRPQTYEFSDETLSLF